MSPINSNTTLYLSHDGLILFLGMFVAIWGIMFLIYYLWCAAALSRIFKKMGIDGWKAFIPLYNDYALTTAVTKDKFPDRPWVIGALAVGTDLLWLLLIRTTFQSSALTPALATIAYAAVWVYVYHQLSLKFGHGKGLTAVLFLLPHVGLAMLGFNKYEHLREPKSTTK